MRIGNVQNPIIADDHRACRTTSGLASIHFPNTISPNGVIAVSSTIKKGMNTTPKRNRSNLSREGRSVIKEIPVCVLAMVMPPVMILKANAMLKAASVSLGAYRRARKALVTECEI